MASAPTNTNPPNPESYQPTSFERIASIVAAAVVVGLVAFLVIRNQPFSDPNFATMTRIVLSLAIAVLGATIPGFLNVSWTGLGGQIKAGGALALFVVSLLYTPKVLPLSADPFRGDYDKGANAYSLGQYEDAVAFLSKVPRDSSTYRLAVNLLGNAEFQLGQYGRALSDYEEASRVSKDGREKLDAEFDIGLTQLYAKNYAEAKKILVPMLDTAEMRDDRSVIFNAASALYNLGEIESAETVFSKFPITGPVPADGESRNLFANAHWLAALFLTRKTPLDCDKVNGEITTALAIDPILRGDITADKSLAVCTEAPGGKK